MPPKPTLPHTQYVCAQCMKRIPSRTLAIKNSSRAFSTSPPPPQPPSSGIAPLTHRGLLSIHGADAAHFLQGLTTSTIPPTTSSNRKSTTGLYSAFLTAQGRVLNDIFIYPAAGNDTFTSSIRDGAGLQENEDAFLIEFDANEGERILKHLKRYKLRSKIQLRPIDPSEWRVWSAWREGERWTPHAQGSTPEIEGGIACIDARAPGMGQRLIVPSSADSALDPLRKELGETDEQAYHIRRILRAVPEGQTEIVREHALPQESNMDFMGGIDFRKGCYVGQELTIRTHHTGVVRKRMLPVMLYDDPQWEPEALEYNPEFRMGNGMSASSVPGFVDMKPAAKKGRSAGKFVTGVGNIGLALARIELMTDVVLTGEGSQWTPDSQFKISWEPEGGVPQDTYVKAFMPEWIMSKIKVKTPNQRVQ